MPVRHFARQSLRYASTYLHCLDAVAEIAAKHVPEPAYAPRSRQQQRLVCMAGVARNRRCEDLDVFVLGARVPN
jgi:hypothetical protein